MNCKRCIDSNSIENAVGLIINDYLSLQEDVRR